MAVYTGEIGFNPFSAVKSVAKGVYNVARDPNVQAAAVATAQQTAPNQYASIAAQSRQYIQKARAIRAAYRGRGAPTAVADDGGGDDSSGGDDDSAPPAKKGAASAAAAGGDAPPLQAHHGLLIVGGAAAAILLIVLLTK